MAAAQDGAPSEEHINDEPLIPVPELRVVLLGGSWSQRMSVGNFILGDDYFKVPNFVGISRRVEKNKLTVINTLDLDYSAKDKLEEFLHEFKTISAPGPHVFLLLIEPKKFTEEDRNRMCCILQTFSDQSFEHSLIMILKPKKYSDYYVAPYVNKPALQELIKKCKCRCLEQKNLELKELLGQIGQIVKEKNLEHVSNGGVEETAASMLVNDSKRLSKQVTTAAVAVNAATDGNKEMASGMSAILRHSFSVKEPNVTCLNLVLCGRREPVKTSAARAILGQTDLPSASNSSGCVRNQGEVCGRWVSVVELPALYGKAQQEVMEESFRCISLCEPEGVHAFILVLPVGSLTDEDKGELQTIQDTFSSRVNDFTMILFTVDSDPTAGDVNFIETDRNIQELLLSCGERYVVLNIEDRQQIPELMEMVETISNKGSRFFMNYMFTSVLIEKTLDEFQDLKQKCLMQGEDNRQSIEKLRKEIEDMKKREEEEKKKHRDEIEALQAQLEQDRKQKVQLVNETDESMEQHCEKIEKEAEKEERTFQKALQHQKGDALEEQADVEQCQREASEKQMKENDITEQMKQKQQLQSSPSLPEDVSKNPVCPTTATSGQMENGTQTSDTDNTGPMESCSLHCLRIVLIGKTGSGKSSSGNTILGKIKFKTEASPQSVTMNCQKAETEVDGRCLAVVDTPGLFDNNLSPEQVNEELMKCIDLLAPGPHVFLLVIPIGRLSPEDRETFTLIEGVLGENYEKFTIILFTKGGALKEDDMSIEDYIKDSCDDSCKRLISDCGGRYHVFENYDKKNRSQVPELIKKIDELIKVNGGNCYTSDLLNDK